ncbi:hypothetical protein ARMSODRAFT_1081093 [Armillaria solidipes]|uniref:Intradiol ring-cleavage dioxygenases domain-containing protein n=1 Tax=Armillaria solidipes TaxID=1076256 RepID=A0A2H3BTA4_9AGAR|nr:hypothetical protein ARMSODRAFT_1081093 [Armillaria solidipes]
MVCFLSIASFALLAATTVAGNPGAAPLSGAEVARSPELHQAARRSLGACQDTLSRRDKMEKSAARRTALVDELQKKRGLITRAPYKRTITSDNVSSTTHLSSGANLIMELDQGMSYVRGGSGVYTYVDLELIDVSTCGTAPDLYIDFWHCNSTGVYSGVLGPGNGIFPTWTKPSSVASSQPMKRDARPSRLSSRATILDVRPIHPQPRNCIREITTNSVDQVFVLGFGSTILEYLYLGDDSLLLWGVIGQRMKPRRLLL